MASATPAVLLDLHSGNPFLVGLAGLDMSPSKYEKGWVSSPLRHGSLSSRSVAQNIVLKIPLEIRAQTETAAATAIENLGLQLSVDNILKVQVGSANPVFYWTFGDPDYAMVVRTSLLGQTRLELEITARPFAYGPRVEVSGSPFTVANDPAGSNPCRFDITGVLGDVPTPMLLVATSTGATGTPSGFVSKRVHVASRRRGTPSNYSNVIQAETMTQSNGGVSTADAAFSAGNKSRVTPVANGSNLLRLNDTFPENGTSVADARGEYRVYARVAKQTASEGFSIQLGYGASSTAPIMNTAVTLPTANTGPWLVNLGLVPVPPWSDPVTIGPSGVPTKAVLPFVGLYVTRTSGTGYLDVDFLYFMPADEPTTVIVSFPATDNAYAIDGTTDSGGAVYSVTTSLDEVLTTATSPQIVGGGGFPELTPGVTNRIHMLRQVDQAGAVDAVANTTTIRAYYWPRWREYGRS